MGYGQYDATTQIFTLDTVPGTQPMLWNQSNGTSIGTSNTSEWDDDTPADGTFITGEYYDYNAAVPCPAQAVGGMVAMWVEPGSTPSCYANCDLSTTQPCLNVLDFGCFLNKFAAGDTYANCDASTVVPVLNVLDFGCFLNKFAAGCSSC
jgi:hypothetical protein